MHYKIFYCSAWKGVSKEWLRAAVVTIDAAEARRAFMAAYNLKCRPRLVTVREATEWEKARWIEDRSTSPIMLSSVRRRVV
jgi:hypothetical protein